MSMACAFTQEKYVYNGKHKIKDQLEAQVPTAALSNDHQPPCQTVSVEQAGRILGISRGAAYARADDGSIPTIRLGKRLLVPKAALDKLLGI